MSCQIDMYVGLLGCGKTTLIKKLLQTEYLGQKVAIIENEIGAVNLDAGELSGTDIAIREITSGCVCCTIQGEFTRAIDMLVETEHPDYIIIEPTGAADIRGLLDACKKVHTASLRRCIMLVNTKKLTRLLKVVGPFYHDQIRQSSCVYLNFTETLTPEQIEEARQALLSINPSLTLVELPMENINSETFSRSSFVLPDSSPSGSITKKAAPSLNVQPLDKKTPVKMLMPRQNQETLYTCTMDIPQPLTPQQFDKLKSALTNTAHCDLWRAKGILSLTTGEKKRLDLTFGDIYEGLSENADSETEGKLVLIGKKINMDWISLQINRL